MGKLATATETANLIKTIIDTVIAVVDARQRYRESNSPKTKLDKKG